MNHEIDYTVQAREQSPSKMASALLSGASLHDSSGQTDCDWSPNGRKRPEASLVSPVPCKRPRVRIAESATGGSVGTHSNLRGARAEVVDLIAASLNMHGLREVCNEHAIRELLLHADSGFFCPTARRLSNVLDDAYHGPALVKAAQHCSTPLFWACLAQRARAASGRTPTERDAALLAAAAELRVHGQGEYEQEEDELMMVFAATALQVPGQGCEGWAVVLPRRG